MVKLNFLNQFLGYAVCSRSRNIYQCTILPQAEIKGCLCINIKGCLCIINSGFLIYSDCGYICLPVLREAKLVPNEIVF